VRLQVPVSGSYNWATSYPATRTLPLFKRVARPGRSVFRLPVVFHVSVSGSYISALLSRAASSFKVGLPAPPATRILPFWSSVAV
jgi:hypothetical protein